MATRGRYVHNYMVNFSRGYPENVSFMQFSQYIHSFRQLYKQNPLEKFFIFTIYQNYTLALMGLVNKVLWLIFFWNHQYFEEKNKIFWMPPKMLP